MSKIILSGDWHFGEKNNSIQHNEDLLEFTDFMIQWSKDNNVNQFVHTGDFFHSRHKIDVHTKDYATEAVRRLTDRFGKYVQLKGNHDLYLTDSREISSLNVYRDKVSLIDYWMFDENTGILYVSWLVSAEEYDEIINLVNDTSARKVDYVVGHFEFSTFRLNDNYLMEHGQTHRSLHNVRRVISGHYHGRQQKDNVTYVGSPFPFDYNDANDIDRGFCVLDTVTDEIEFINWEKVSILSMSYQDVLEADFTDLENCSLRVVIDDDVDSETMDLIKEKLQGTAFRDTKIKYDVDVVDIASEGNTELVGDVTDVDQFVVQYIKGMEPNDNVNKDLLESIYNEAVTSAKEEE